MALNKEAFRTRTLTAVIFVAVMLLGLFWNHWSFFVLFSVIHVGCWLEYQKLVGLIDKEYATITPFHKYGVIIAGWCIMLFFTNDAFDIGDFKLHAVGFWAGMIFAFILPIIELLFAGNIQLKNIGYSLLGLLYISLSCGLMIHLRTMGMIRKGASDAFLDFGLFLPCGLIFSIWINDTMAYIVGSLIGKTPFSSISPKKTWEGTIGGAILCVIVIALQAWWMGLPVIHWIMIAAIAAIAGTAGDLLESKIKRMAGVKDSGTIMPGHGGFLDRFDSLLIAIPFVWLYVVLFGWA